MSTEKPNARRLRAAARALALLAALTAALLAPSAAGAAGPAAAWKLNLIPRPTNFAPGTHGTAQAGAVYVFRATNVGEAPAPGPVTITDTLPAGLTPGGLEKQCSAVGQTVTCTIAKTIYPSGHLQASFGVDVEAGLQDPSTILNEATVASPGVPPQTARTQTTISSEEAPFGFPAGANGLSAILGGADGSPATGAGAHPSQLTINVEFQSKRGSFSPNLAPVVPAGGGTRDVYTTLPKGLIIDPTGTPVRCTEAQFETLTCPDASAIGRANVGINLAGNPVFSSDPIYTLVAPPGSAASFGFDPTATGLHVHVLGGVRAGDYALRGAVEDVPALFENVLFGSQLQFWGDPSAASHDHLRGVQCNGEVTQGSDEVPSCPLQERAGTPALTNPTSCGPSLSIEAEMDSWEAPGKFVSSSTPFTDLEANPAETVSGCNAVPFKPSLSAQPTTNLADSPSGLNVDLKIPQATGLGSTATAHLKQAVVTLPEGLVVNPSSANGLAGCSPEQIGIDPTTGVANGNPARCPNAAKIGKVEVESPLLAQYDSGEKVQRDSEGHVIAEPIQGAVYIATPHQNPFGSLLAIYLAFEDPAHGIVVKLAGKVSADPRTGRLTTSFADNPQLPFEHFKLHFFGGAAAALRTPLACGTKTVTSDLTPWSAPEGADATPADSFQVSAEPGGGPCPTSDAQAANHPAFSAGTLAPQAGAYSPLTLEFSREDGSAPISGIETTLPLGLTGKLAGIAYCPQAALIAAAAKSGNAEKQSPSCPASSEVGSVVVGAGAGPTPYYTTGKAYLAGPYKSAPLSLAIITPATAGPYDLGTVVVRVALNVDPESGRIHAVSDPIPQILQGIPLDVRSIALKMDRPSFTLNPTNCDPLVLSASASSPLGSPAALSNPFQVGGCEALPFKPKLALKLSGGTKRGSHPALEAVLTARSGEANIARAVVALPHSEFLEQAHIKTICTRVQFAASQCPAGSIYGQATAITPLLDQPLSGPVYLRSSAHPLPDLVADLDGQIQIDLVGRVDSVKGGIRTSFEGVPDAPVSKFTLSMQGGKKGLLVNSRDICKGKNKASVQMDGQNGKASDTQPELVAQCGRKGKRGKR